MIEVHHDPANALSDGPQSLFFENFIELKKQIEVISNAMKLEVFESYE